MLFLKEPIFIETSFSGENAALIITYSNPYIFRKDFVIEDYSKTCKLNYIFQNIP